MKLILVVVCFLSPIGAGFAWHQLQPASSEKQEIKKAKRDARYKDPVRLKEGKKMSTLPPNTRVSHFPPMPFLMPDEGTLKAEKNKAIKERNKLICDSAAIVRGQVTKSAGTVTDDDSAIYSVYQFTISDVLRGDLLKNATIEVTGLGGIAQINGKRITYEPFGASILHQKQEYILFLNYEKESEDYTLIGDQGIYLIFDRGIARADVRNNKAQTGLNFQLGVPQQLNELQSEVNSANCK